MISTIDVAQEQTTQMEFASYVIFPELNIKGTLI